MPTADIQSFLDGLYEIYASLYNEQSFLEYDPALAVSSSSPYSERKVKPLRPALAVLCHFYPKDHDQLEIRAEGAAEKQYTVLFDVPTKEFILKGVLPSSPTEAEIAEHYDTFLKSRFSVLGQTYLICEVLYPLVLGGVPIIYQFRARKALPNE